MKAAKVSYHRAASLDEALDLLASDADLRLLSGGQSLLPMLNMRLLRPELLLDIAELSELRGMQRDGDRLVIGALVTYRELERSSLVTAAAPLLATAVRCVGDLQVRNRGTVGGSLAHADPTAELPLACLTLGAEVRLQSRRGSRRLPLQDFLVGPYETAIDDDELVTGLDLNAGSRRFGFAEATRRHNDFAIVSAAAAGVIAPNGTIEDLTIGLGGVADTVTLVPRAAALLRGQPPGEEVLSAAAAACQDEISPTSDTRASADYRRHLAGEYLRRVVLQMATTDGVQAA